ncbi:MAG TPA: hypothetical protein VIU46_08465 [Gallionellaceae bacterium]
MAENERPQPRSKDGSHTTLKVMGIEFSGPAWLAVIFMVSIVVVAALYFGSGQGADAGQAAPASDSASQSAD